MSLQVDRRTEWIRTRRQRRNQFRQARWRRWLIRYLALALILLAGAAGFAYLPWSLDFRDGACLLRGNHVVTGRQVAALLSVADGKPLYLIDPDSISQRLQSLPAVRFAFVRRHLLPRPHLVVEILEEYPWATFSLSPDTEAVAVISDTGRAIPLRVFPTFYRPSFTIFARPDLTLSAAQVERWSRHIAYIEQQTGKVLDYLDLRRPHEIEIGAGDLRLKIGSADQTLTKRLGRLAAVMPVVDRLQRRLDYINLSLDSNVPLKLGEAISKDPAFKDKGSEPRSDWQPEPTGSTASR